MGDEADDLDVLIIPLPFEMWDEWIVQDGNSKPEPTKRPKWGNFEIKQGWLEDQEKLIELILGEFRKAVAGTSTAMRSSTTRLSSSILSARIAR
ncbi:hypothetical protein [Rhizobium ruizarguesonis]|uniref:hypothetical protein n=1 Tax=Rhizobium ruizarguesonis TaxID=2081791 RepID=UPI0010307D4D|nr:hypothetical protein [Rhizobium ruizarguesonis]TBA34783.1 hypothetical protein ELH63_29855 [Rhizobium ruizarguesonis]